MVKEYLVQHDSKGYFISKTFNVNTFEEWSQADWEHAHINDYTVRQLGNNEKLDMNIKGLDNLDTPVYLLDNGYEHAYFVVETVI